MSPSSGSSAASINNFGTPASVLILFGIRQRQLPAILVIQPLEAELAPSVPSAEIRPALAARRRPSPSARACRRPSPAPARARACRLPPRAAPRTRPGCSPTSQNWPDRHRSALRHRINRRAHFIRLVIPERRNPVVGAVRREIENEHVVLVILQRGNQRQQLAFAGPIPMAKNNRRSAAKSRKEPALPRTLAAGDRKLHGIGPPWKTLPG